MVNYECLIISANQKLEEEGKEPLYVVYPYDGLSIADSPLGYVDHGKKKKEEAFLKIQDYLLSDEVQNEIQRTGRWTGYEGVKEENAEKNFLQAGERDVNLVILGAGGYYLYSRNSQTTVLKGYLGGERRFLYGYGETCADDHGIHSVCRYRI